MTTDVSPRVLVVDDEPMVREVLARYLERDGFTVDLAVDGVDALQHLESVGADLVVLDLMLPRLDGFEVLRRLRSRVATPVIMLTARGDQIDRIVGLEVGADDYVIKPFSPGRWWPGFALSYGEPRSAPLRTSRRSSKTYGGSVP